MISMKTMNSKKQDIIGLVDKMPAFPRSVHRVMELTSDINCNPKDLIEVIEHDPVLILKILKLVNSAYFGLSQPITSINHAVVYIGLNTVKNLALSTATIGVLPRRNEAGFDMDAFLLHSLSTATIARLFARKLKSKEKDPFDFFLSGLLHDFGKILFAHFMPHEFQKALNMAKENAIHLYEAETEIFDIDHAQIGSLLGEKWQLPSNIIAPLRGHHCPDNDPSVLTNVVTAANQISKELKMGNSGESIIEKIPDEITAIFGPDIDGIVVALGDINAEIDKAMMFIKI